MIKSILPDALAGHVNFIVSHYHLSVSLHRVKTLGKLELYWGEKKKKKSELANLQRWSQTIQLFGTYMVLTLKSGV